MGKRDGKSKILLIATEENAYSLKEYYEIMFPKEKYELYTNSNILNYTLENTERMLPDEDLLVFDDRSIERLIENSDLPFDVIIVHKDYEHLIYKLVSSNYTSIILLGNERIIGVIDNNKTRKFPSVELKTPDLLNAMNKAISEYIH